MVGGPDLGSESDSTEDAQGQERWGSAVGLGAQGVDSEKIEGPCLGVRSRALDKGPSHILV